MTLAQGPAAPRGLLPLYAVTVFTSACLLFEVQPIIAKAILPWFGGSAVVWTTAMLFFQAMLLAGYGYAHWLVSAAPPKAQVAIHAAVLAAAAALLPIAPAGRWRPAGDASAPLAILLLLAASAGAPYFALSATSPLLQAWYARASGGALPYRLFALSNLGSLLALLAYPFAIEPFIGLARQMNLWSGAFAVCAALCIAAGAASLRRPAAAAAPEPAERPEPVPPAVWLRWLLLPACSSALLLAATNTICQDVAAIPFLWILPLSLYLLSFVLCFDRPAFYRRGFWLRLLAVALGLMAYAGLERSASLVLDLCIFGGGLFVCCIFCHGELAAAKPAPARLTLYYAMLSLGSVAGALAVSLGAPAVFTGYTELPAALVFCAVLALFAVYGRGWLLNGVWAALVVLLASAAAARVQMEQADVRFAARNAYGALRVRQLTQDGEQFRRLYHGAIVHGVGMVRPDLRLEPTAYYGRASGVALAIENWRRPSMRVAAIGLGAGTIAVYSRPGDAYRFYEINPLVADIAQRYFPFLAASAGHMEVALGDARLTLAAERGTRYDVLVVDAFSGDSVPVHLLTREAFGVYFEHLAPGGVLALHISNRYLNLAPVVAQLAAAWGRQARAVSSPAQKIPEIYKADWVLVAAPADFAARPQAAAGTLPLLAAPGRRPWTDDFSNLLAAVRR